MAIVVPPTTEPRSRRAILAGALGGVAGLVASRFASPDRISAAAGGPVIMGAANDAGTTNTSLTAAGTGTAMLVTQTGTGTALRGSAIGAGSIAGFFTSANGTGVSGITAKSNQFGVYGANDAVTNGGGEAIRANGQQNHGLVATTASVDANAIYALDTSTGTAIFGWSTPASGTFGRGVQGQADGVGGTGVFGYASADSGTSIGVYGQAISASGYGVYCSGNEHVGGNLDVSGAITATTKDFKIDHPLDPAQKFLSHSCVESDDRRTVYDGEVTLDARGEATVILPAWFETLNKSFRYQLTAIGWLIRTLHVKSKVKSNAFSIGGGNAGQEVCWLITGVRQDPYAKAHPLTVEAAKTGTERGRYLHPEVYGKAASRSIDALHARPVPAAAGH